MAAFMETFELTSQESISIENGMILINYSRLKSGA
jgi:hypothetical protein